MMSLDHEISYFSKYRGKYHNSHHLTERPLIVDIGIASCVCQCSLDASQSYDAPELGNSKKRDDDEYAANHIYGLSFIWDMRRNLLLE